MCILWELFYCENIVLFVCFEVKFIIFTNNLIILKKKKLYYWLFIIKYIYTFIFQIGNKMFDRNWKFNGLLTFSNIK